MQINELPIVYAYTKSVISSFQIPKDKLELACLNAAWLKHLQDYDLDIIYSAIDAYAIDNKFCNVAQVAELCEKMTRVKKGTYRPNMYYINEIAKAFDQEKKWEAYNNLSQIAKSTVGDMKSFFRYYHMYSSDYSYYNSVVVPRFLKQIDEYMLLNKMNKRLEQNQIMAPIQKIRLLEQK